VGEVNIYLKTSSDIIKRNKVYKTNEHESPNTQENGQVCRVLIKEGSSISQDRYFGKWPSQANGKPVDANVVFNAKWSGDHWECTRYGFGQIKGGMDSYGNGAIYCYGLESVRIIENTQTTLPSKHDKHAPVVNYIYTLKEVTELLLRDNPALIISNEGVVQSSHVTDQELLSVPGIQETKWRFIRETKEWIPVFKYCSEQPWRDFFDCEPYVDPYQKYDCDGQERSLLWITPKGFPRDQS
jgi:hypothetical protein